MGKARRPVKRLPTPPEWVPAPPPVVVPPPVVPPPVVVPPVPPEVVPPPGVVVVCNLLQMIAYLNLCPRAWKGERPYAT